MDHYMLYLYHFAIPSLFAFVLKTNRASGYYYMILKKAKMGYEELLVNIPQNMQYFLRVIDCYQLQQFNSAEKAIQARLRKVQPGSLLLWNWAITFSYKKGG
jgi:hypothetical protein